MLILRYRNRTFFIHQLYVDGFVIITGFLAGSAIRYVIKKYKKPDSLPNPSTPNSDPTQSNPKIRKIRGGDMDVAQIIKDCMVNYGLYEVTNQKIVKIAQHVFNLKRKNVVIHVASFVMLHIIGNKVKYLVQNPIFSIAVVMTNFQKIKTYGLGIAAITAGLKVCFTGSMLAGCALVTMVALSFVNLPVDCEKEVMFLAPTIDDQIYVRALPSSYNKNGNRVFVNVYTPPELEPKESRQLALEQGTTQVINHEIELMAKTKTPEVIKEMKDVTLGSRKKTPPYKIYYPRTLGNAEKGGKKDAMYNRAYANFEYGKTYFEKRYSATLHPGVLVDQINNYVPIAKRYLPVTRQYTPLVPMNKQNPQVTDLSDVRRGDDTETIIKFESIVNNMCQRDQDRIRVATDQYCE
jgi:hypothetical protein